MTTDFIIIKCHPNLASWMKRQAENFQKVLPKSKISPRDFEAKLGDSLPDVSFDVIIGKRKGRGKIRVKSEFII